MSGLEHVQYRDGPSHCRLLLDPLLKRLDLAQECRIFDTVLLTAVDHDLDPAGAADVRLDEIVGHTRRETFGEILERIGIDLVAKREGQAAEADNRSDGQHRYAVLLDEFERPRHQALAAGSLLLRHPSTLQRQDEQERPRHQIGQDPVDQCTDTRHGAERAQRFEVRRREAEEANRGRHAGEKRGLEVIQ